MRGGSPSSPRWLRDVFADPADESIDHLRNITPSIIESLFDVFALLVAVLLNRAIHTRRKDFLEDRLSFHAARVEELRKLPLWEYHRLLELRLIQPDDAVDLDVCFLMPRGDHLPMPRRGRLPDLCRRSFACRSLTPTLGSGEFRRSTHSVVPARGTELKLGETGIRWIGEVRAQALPIRVTSGHVAVQRKHQRVNDG